MLLHREPLLTLFFGDERTSFEPAALKAQLATKDLFTLEPFVQVQQQLGLNSLLFLHQTHSADGYTITSVEQAERTKPYEKEGDFIVTTIPHAGVAVATADCLPIVIFDPLNHAVAIVHAGWKGAVQRVAVRALEAMHEVAGTQPGRVRVFFGPAAKVCCYQVQRSFGEHLEPFHFADHVILERSGNLFFDNVLFNRLLLEDAGVNKEAFKLKYNACTMCNDSFCSYRRHSNKALRQMTVAVLT